MTESVIERLHSHLDKGELDEANDLAKRHIEYSWIEDMALSEDKGRLVVDTDLFVGVFDLRYKYYRRRRRDQEVLIKPIGKWHLKTRPSFTVTAPWCATDGLQGIVHRRHSDTVRNGVEA